MKKEGPPCTWRPRMRQMREWTSVLLDLLEHLEDALGRAHEHALEGLGQATTLERVAAGAGTFGHGLSSGIRWVPAPSLSGAGENSIFYSSLEFFASSRPRWARTSSASPRN